MARNICWKIRAAERTELIADAEAVSKLLVCKPQDLAASHFGAQQFVSPLGVVFDTARLRKQADYFAPPPSTVSRATWVMNGPQIHLSNVQRFHEVREKKKLGLRCYLICRDGSVEWHSLFLTFSDSPMQFSFVCGRWTTLRIDRRISFRSMPKQIGRGVSLVNWEPFQQGLT